MDNLSLYNTLTNKQERFEPRQADSVKLFTCGPSVYRRQHLGNYRTYLYEDVLEEYLTYLGYRVERVVNFTDVDTHMKDNLDFAAAFDAVADRIVRISELDNTSGIPAKQRRRLSGTLADVDNVLGVLDCGDSDDEQ